MELNKLREFLLDSKSTEFNPIIQVIDEVNIVINDENDTKFNKHRVLREKIFLIVQLIVETNSELLIKFILNTLRIYLIDEIKCDICSLKEKSQFLLNILRYIQQASFHSALTKLEIFKFLINNHDTIEPYLTSKIFDCLLSISTGELESENEFLKSSSKALIIKYIAVVCNQTKKKINLKENSDEQQNFDFFLVDSFGILLDIFNQDFRSFEIRNLILECIEQLLSNLISERKSFFEIRNNSLFIEFAWKKFCPAILCQFAACDISNKLCENHSLNFKQIYTILIQLTSLLGGNKIMIPVFEAIYQRVLTFSSDQDNQIILKIFKSYVTKDFLVSLIASSGTDCSNLSIKDLSLINIIMGFYRNCFEQSNKEPNDKVLQFLSFECIHSFINIVYELYEESLELETENLVNQKKNGELNSNLSHLSDIDEALVNNLSDKYVKEVVDFSKQLSQAKFFNLGQEIKKFSINFLENSGENFLKKNSFKFLIASYTSIYFLANKSKNSLDRTILIDRVLNYDECDFSEDSDRQTDLFNAWLEKLFFKMISNSLEISNENSKQIDLLIKQIDCCSSEEKNSKKQKFKNLTTVENVLKCCWSYLIDVLVGFLENSKLNSIETALFMQSLDDIFLEDTSNDITYLNFAIKSNLDSLRKLIKILASIESMDKELEQIFFILIESNFYKNSFLKYVEELSLNKIISLDFVLYTTTNLLIDSENFSLPITTSAEKILWKYLVESVFFCLSLQANLENNEISIAKNSYRDNLTKYILAKKQKIFNSVYSNLNEASEPFSGVNRTKSLDLSDKSELNDQIIQSIFYFLKNSKLDTTVKKLDLIDCLANKAYDCVFKKLFAKLYENGESYFGHVWKLCFNLCLFSKRFLTDEPKLRLQLEYFSFNFLIVDKLEDFLTRLMANSDLFIFFTDIWLNVFLTYFEKIFSKCALIRTFSIQNDRTNKKASLLKKQSSNDSKSCSIIDFTIFKKIISMIQNLFEMHNSTNLNLDFAQYRNKQAFLEQNLIKTPSISPSTSASSPISITHDFNEPAHLLQKLEIYKNELNKQSNGDFVSKIFYTNTIFLLSQSNEIPNPQIYSIDQIYNLNNILLIPYKRLMARKYLQPNLRDTILVSICELVERSSHKIINCWSLVFHCISRIVLDEKIDKNCSLNFNSDQSDSSVYSSEDEEKLSDSLSNDSDRCFSKASFILPSAPYRFESYRLRLNSLKEVFDIFLDMANNSEYIMCFGGFDFIKCVSNYLQYKASISNDLSDQIVVIKMEESDLIEEENTASDQESEDLFLSANDYSIQERHYHYTSNYDHLCELSNASNSNTQNKVFIKCFEKMFEIILDYKQNSDNSKFSIQIKNFKISIFQKNSTINFENLTGFLNNDEINDLNYFEKEDYMDELNFEFENFFLNDLKNYSKMIVYLFKNLTSRILMAHDEINSVQIVQLIFDLALRLVQKNELETLGYVILDVLLPEINFQLDLNEFKNVKINFIQTKFNRKLLVNSFFISNLVSKMIEKMISLCTSFIKMSKWNSIQKVIIHSITNRIFCLISKCLLKKLTNFDAFSEANCTQQLKDLYETCFKIGELTLCKICQNSIKLFHTMSLIPFETLSLSQKSELNPDRKNFSHMEVLTEKCKTAWELHNVKKAFQHAKYLLNSDSLKLSQSFDESDIKLEELENEDDSLKSANDDKNFFRDFSLKFSTNSSMKKSSIFENSNDLKQINLTCFIKTFKFHMDFLNLFNYLSLEIDEFFLYEAIKCLTLTYLVSIRLEQNLPLKILLSKIFYLNYENSLANFAILTKKSFSIINFLFFKKDLIRLELNFKSSFEKFNYDSFSELNESERLQILIKNDPKKNFFEIFFSTFISQINNFYKYLFESSHQIKLVNDILKNFLNKFENQDLTGYSEETLNQEIELFMQDFREKNKTDMESYEMDKIENVGENYLDRDAKNLFRIWSQEIIPYLFLYLSKQVSIETSELYLVNLINFYSSHNDIKINLIINLAELILLFNSCNSFCKCSANIENEFSFCKIDFNTFKSIANKLMSILAILVSKK